MNERDGSGGADERLRSAFEARQHLDLRTGQIDQDRPSMGSQWPAGRQVSAEVVGELLTADPELVHGKAAVLRIVGARVVGQLNLRHARIKYALIMEYCSFDTGVDLSEAKMASVSFKGSLMPSLGCYGLQLEGDLDCAEAQVGKIDVFGAHIGGRFWLYGAKLGGSGDGYALNAPDLMVDGGMYCYGGFHAAGGVNLFGATVGSTLEFGDATLSRPAGSALRAPGLTVKFDMSCTGDFCSTGQIDLFGAQIGGQLWFGGAQLDQGESSYALSAPLLNVGGGMYCNGGFRAVGGINLYDATIGSTLEFANATLANTDGCALRAPNITVRADMECASELVIKGAIELTGAHIGGQLRLATATLSDATVDLRGAEVRDLVADPSTWPARHRLNGLTYAVVEPYLDATVRVAWLRCDPSSYQPQPYEQLAAFYRKLGQDEQARAVLLSKQRHRREGLHTLTKAWGWAQDITVGYGYKPARALASLVFLITATAIYFTLQPAHPISHTVSTRFQPIIYAFDILVPIVDFGQQKNYAPVGAGEWIAWIAMVAGWILVTTVVAGMTRVLSRN